MKRILEIALIWITMTGFAWGGALGDVNADGMVGIPEAIHALQVTSGFRPQAVSQKYDLADYFYVPGAVYEARQTMSGSSIQTYTAQGQSTVSTVTVSGKEYIVYNDIDYYEIDTEKIYHSGYKPAGSSSINWYSTPLVIGSRSMSPGEMFTTFYRDPTDSQAALRYREQTFLGIETVTVPAGTFTDCLKILRKTQYASYSIIQVSYYGRGIGLVKTTRLSMFGASSGEETELVGAKIGETTYPPSEVFYSGGGTWSRTISGAPSGSGSFTWRFSLPNLPAWGTVTLIGLNSGSNPDMSMPLVSQDGVHFSASWYPSPIDFAIDLGEGTITGTYVPSAGTAVNLNGSYSQVQ